MSNSQGPSLPENDTDTEQEGQAIKEKVDRAACREVATDQQERTFSEKKNQQENDNMQLLIPLPKK